MNYLRLLLTLTLFSLLACSVTVPNRYPSSKEIHIILDLDWTIVSPVENVLTGKNIISVEGELYRLHEGAKELLEQLFRTPGVKVSFFSGGSRERNFQLLSQLKLFDGNENAYSRAYKVLSKDDLTRLESVPETARFSEKFKKDISKISKDLDNIIIIEDNPFFAINKEQSKSFLFLGQTYKYFESFEESQLAMKNLKNPTEQELKYYPRNWIEWKLNRDRLKILHQTLNESLERKGSVNSFSKQVMTNWSRFGLNNNNPRWDLLSEHLDESNQCSNLMFKLLIQ